MAHTQIIAAINLLAASLLLAAHAARAQDFSSKPQAAVRSDHRLHADQHDRDRAESAGQPSETAGTGPRIEGATPAGMSAVDFAAFVRADVARWAPIVRQSGARLD